MHYFCGCAWMEGRIILLMILRLFNELFPGSLLLSDSSKGQVPGAFLEKSKQLLGKKYRAFLCKK